jgi:hypothetical protein
MEELLRLRRDELAAIIARGKCTSHPASASSTSP